MIAVIQTFVYPERLAIARDAARAARQETDGASAARSAA